MYCTIWRYIVVNVDEMIQYAYILYCTVYNMYLREKNCVTKKWVCGGCVMAVRWICDGCKCVMCVMDV